MTTTSTATTPEENARRVIQSLLSGNVPNGTLPGDCGNWANVVTALLDAYTHGGTTQVITTYNALIRANPSLIVLMASGTNPLLRDAPLSDTGNAECLAELYGQDIRYCHTHGNWKIWDGRRWQIDMRDLVRTYAVEVARGRRMAAAAIKNNSADSIALFKWALRSENVGGVGGTLMQTQSLSKISTVAEDYDRDPMLATGETGTLDLRTCTVRSACREDLITKTISTTYDATARCSRFLQFLDEVFNKDADLISYIQRWAGYSITGDIREQQFLVCYGNGSNGKGVLFSILTSLLGDYAANASFESFDFHRRKGVGEDLAALQGKRFVTVVEPNADRRLDEGLVKQLTGGDPVTCRFLYDKSVFTYQPQFKLWFAMNHLPIIRGQDKGIWRRVRVIPFTQDFEGREDKTLEAWLRKHELPGILNWVLDGLRAWQSQGLGTCAAVEQATKAYREESDVLRPWIAEECLIGDPAYEMRATELWRSYQNWCDTNGEKPAADNQTTFGRLLAARGYPSEVPKSGPNRDKTVRKGIVLK